MKSDTTAEIGSDCYIGGGGVFLGEERKKKGVNWQVLLLFAG